MIVHIKLTKSQKEKLEPLFAAIRKSGGCDAILGQVFYDGIAARIVEFPKITKVQKALNNGKTSMRRISSSMQQMGEIE